MDARTQWPVLVGVEGSPDGEIERREAAALEDALAAWQRRVGVPAEES